MQLCKCNTIHFLAFLNERGQETAFVDNMPSRKWCRKFLKRHHTLVSVRRIQRLAINRVQKINKKTIEAWFERLEERVDKLGIRDLSDHVYNCDESGMVLNGTQDLVVCRRGSKNPYSLTNNNSRVTVRANDNNYEKLYVSANAIRLGYGLALRSGRWYFPATHDFIQG